VTKVRDTQIRQVHLRAGGPVGLGAMADFRVDRSSIASGSASRAEVERPGSVEAAPLRPSRLSSRLRTDAVLEVPSRPHLRGSRSWGLEVGREEQGEERPPGGRKTAAAWWVGLWRSESRASGIAWSGGIMELSAPRSIRLSVNPSWIGGAVRMSGVGRLWSAAQIAYRAGPLRASIRALAPARPRSGSGRIGTMDFEVAWRWPHD
jgi:hypothetical protein